MLTFAYYYLRSMRLYYGFVTGTTTLVGCLLSGHTLAESRTWLLFTMGFFAWGFNQIFSDWYDRHEDAINAPHRPMVTGGAQTGSGLCGFARRTRLNRRHWFHPFAMDACLSGHWRNSEHRLFVLEACAGHQLSRLCLRDYVLRAVRLCRFAWWDYGT